MADTVYGLTVAGFVAKPLQVIKSENEASLQSVFGQNINLAPNSNFGQLVGIQSEREALIWQLAEAVYASQSPSGAEGTSVDNILALNNMRRQLPQPTRTNPTPVTQSNGITLYGLVLKGTAGTVIPAGSLVQTNAAPPLQFGLVSAVTIAAASNAVQSLFMSNTPDSGAFQVSIVSPQKNTLLTPSMPFNVQAQATNFKFSTTPISGTYSLRLTVAGVPSNAPSVAFGASAAQLQTAIRTVSGYSAVTVTGSAAAGFVISWGSIRNPLVTFNTNTTGFGATFIDSLQAQFNNLLDSGPVYPFIDVLVSVNASGFNFTFAGSSGALSQPLILLVTNSLQNGLTVTNINIVNNTQGAPARGIGSASCVSNGPNFVAGGSLNTIGTSISGWTGVDNELDCITGSLIESDTAALQRREANLQAQANGPLQSIIQKVRALPNVITAIGFENLTEAALQLISFSVTPVSGQYKLVLDGTPTAFIPYNATSLQVQTAINGISGYDVVVTGDMSIGYTIDFNGSFGGQPQPAIVATSNTTGSAILIAFGRPGKSFEIVAEGGSDVDIATTILNSKPAGIETYGSTSTLVYDVYGNPYNIKFSRPTAIPIYMVIALQTDYTDVAPKFNPQSIQTIQQDLVAIGDAFGIGGLIIGFGTNGLIGAFNNVPGIKNYTLYFDRVISPTGNANIQMQPQEVPQFETFNIAVSYT